MEYIFLDFDPDFWNLSTLKENLKEEFGEYDENDLIMIKTDYGGRLEEEVIKYRFHLSLNLRGIRYEKIDGWPDRHSLDIKFLNLYPSYRVLPDDHPLRHNGYIRGCGCEDISLYQRKSDIADGVWLFMPNIYINIPEAVWYDDWDHTIRGAVHLLI